VLPGEHRCPPPCEHHPDRDRRPHADRRPPTCV
jgi:hypothetical protein